MTTRRHDPIHISTLQLTKAESRWMGRGLWLMLMLLLCATNILTLLDDGFRRNAYEAVSRIARPALDGIGMASSARILIENSPAALEKKAVERATAELAARSALLLRDVQLLTQERDGLVAQRTKLDKQLRASQAVVAKHKARVSQLGKAVLGRAARSVIRHLGALPGHALPVLSATVAVGSVVFDIRDACDSIKELDELNQSVGLPPADRSQVCGRTVPSAQELLAGARGNWEAIYRNSAAALNTGATMIPQTPPISVQSARKWLSGIF
jgi:hypothetical protein